MMEMSLTKTEDRERNLDSYVCSKDEYPLSFKTTKDSSHFSPLSQASG